MQDCLPDTRAARQRPCPDPVSVMLLFPLSCGCGRQSLDERLQQELVQQGFSDKFMFSPGPNRRGHPAKLFPKHAVSSSYVPPEVPPAPPAPTHVPATGSSDSPSDPRPDAPAHAVDPGVEADGKPPGEHIQAWASQCYSLFQVMLTLRRTSTDWMKGVV